MQPETNAGEYGIVANVLEADPVFWPGAKVWLCGGENGDGFENRIFYGLGKDSRRPIEKWARTIRFHNFRCAWIPVALRPHILIYRGTRPEVEETSRELDALTQERRAIRDSNQSCAK